MNNPIRYVSENDTIVDVDQNELLQVCFASRQDVEYICKAVNVMPNIERGIYEIKGKLESRHHFDEDQIQIVLNEINTLMKLIKE